MTQFNEPNRFCGSCNCYLAYGEPETSSEENEKILKVHCAECKSWRYNGIQLLNKDEVGQYWHCIHQTEFEEIYSTSSHESVLVPFCNHKKLIVIGNKGYDICPHFKDRGGTNF